VNVLDLARPEILKLRPYVTAEQRAATVRLNANEFPHAPPQSPPAAHGDALNRYPAIRPDAIEARLAALYRIAATRLLATRGSSEAIDTLLRAFCRPYTDNIVVTSPSFSMYRVYADLQAADVLTVALDAGNDFALDPAAVVAACNAESKLIFLCSPNNPTGGLIPECDILSIADARAGQSLVVVDEAYVEFSDRDSMAARIGEYDNLVVLRTLSKAQALAGARCGAVLASAPIIDLLRRIAPPYAFSTPATTSVLRQLAQTADGRQARLIDGIVAERERLREQLAGLDCVDRTWPSAGNFLLVRFHDLKAVQQALERAGILIRPFSDAALANCARITIGTPPENNRLLAELESAPVAEIRRCR